MNKIILFDHECNFCDSSVLFIIKRDPNELFHFASLKSEVGKDLLKKYRVPDGIDSIVFIDGEKAYVKSSAALRICRHLRGPWKWLYLFNIVPNVCRNGIYDWIAKNRYKWFGKKEGCRLPPPSVQKRFL